MRPLPQCLRCGQPRHPAALGKDGWCDRCRRPARECSVLNCHKRIKARQMCENHYRAWKLYGDPFHTRADHPRQRCTATACERYARSRGLCATHYKQWERTGSTHPIGPQHGGKRVRRDSSELALEVELMLGTDSGDSIARRLGYADLDSLATTLGRKHKRLADRLRAEKEVAA